MICSSTTPRRHNLKNTLISHDDCLKINVFDFERVSGNSAIDARVESESLVLGPISNVAELIGVTKSHSQGKQR